MALKIRRKSGIGYYLSGLKKSFARYERDLASGRIACPFTVVFRDSQLSWGNFTKDRERADIPHVVEEGSIVTTSCVPLTPDGKPKINLFAK